MSVSERACERFHLDSGRFAAHLIAQEGAPFGFDCDERISRVCAVLVRYYEAETVGAIRGPEDTEVLVYSLNSRALIVAVREKSPPPYLSWPLRQVATFSFDAEEIAPPGDASFETCLDGLGELMERANALLPDLAAIRTAEVEKSLAQAARGAA